jgi:hypothetical protein
MNEARQKTASRRNVPLLGAGRTSSITLLYLQHRLIARRFGKNLSLEAWVYIG